MHSKTMHTDDLISLLARDPLPTPRHALYRTGAALLLLALVLSAMLLLGWWHINPHLSTLAQLPAFWVKVAWLVAMGLGAGIALRCLAYPTAARSQLAGGLFAIAAALIAMLVLALNQFYQADAPLRAALWWGMSWRSCPWSIAFLAVPILGASLWLVRAMAPIRATLSGTLAGCFAGIVSALLYSIHCPETAYPFLLLWYLVGIAMSSLLGALLGRHLLRW